MCRGRVNMLREVWLCWVVKDRMPFGTYRRLQVTSDNLSRDYSIAFTRRCRRLEINSFWRAQRDAARYWRKQISVYCPFFRKGSRLM